MVKKKKRLSKFNQIWIGVLLIMLAILVSGMLFFTQAANPYLQARREAISLAKSKTALKTVTHFEITNTVTTTYSLIGFDNDKQTLGILIPTEGGEIKVVKLADNQSKLTEKTAKLTLYENKVVWQKADMTLYEFETGKKINK